MKLFNKYGPCRGITLFRWKRHLVELWICPKGYQIPEHRHPREHIELFFLYGHNTKMYRRDIDSKTRETVVCSWPRNMFKRFTIKPIHAHSFQVSNSLLIFINWERWLGVGKPTSAAEDFELT